MTEKTNNNTIEDYLKDYCRLSIQISLNGLSFCVLDTISNKIIDAQRVQFTKELPPDLVLKELRQLLEKNQIDHSVFLDVVVVHRNHLFSLVPKPMFDVSELANYLKFNVRILTNDQLAHDEFENLEMANVYVPFMNINNYIYDLFGEFVYKHHGTVMIQSLMGIHTRKELVCYVHLSNRQMDVTVISNKKLLFFNCFENGSDEDFLYYLLFTFEQLQLDPETIPLKLFGEIAEDDSLYLLCYQYVRHLSIMKTTNVTHALEVTPESENIDFTLINAL
ncbi:MAG: DUF3822 family protein [Flavobacteriales bacterium]|nr:MAG: DUF3822 family protein [Flavobacteriales bacterium]